MRLRLAALLLLALASSAGMARDRGPARGGHGPDGHGTGDPTQQHFYANPSAVIAAELAFNHLAQEKGQWTASLATAAPEAEMFVPERVKAAEWLKDRANPAVAVKREPYAVWMSCDGSYAVMRGGWRQGAAAGSFVTVWQRQEDGGYKWLLHEDEKQSVPPFAPDMISGKVADCAPGANPVPAARPPAGTDARDGSSSDHTLQWTSWVDEHGGRLFMAFVWNGKAMDEALRVSVPASAGNGS